MFYSGCSEGTVCVCERKREKREKKKGRGLSSSPLMECRPVKSAWQSDYGKKRPVNENEEEKEGMLPSRGPYHQRTLWDCLLRHYWRAEWAWSTDWIVLYHALLSLLHRVGITGVAQFRGPSATFFQYFLGGGGENSSLPTIRIVWKHLQVYS